MTLFVRGDSGFCVNTASRVLDLEMLDEAKALYLVEYPVKEAPPAVVDPYGGLSAGQVSQQSAPSKFNRKRGKGNRSISNKGKRQADDGWYYQSGPSNKKWQKRQR